MNKAEQYNIKLQYGDVFASSNHALDAKIIDFVEKIWSHDNEAYYNHTGIIINPDGTTLEALLTVRSQNIYRAYHGRKIIIARWKYMNHETFHLAFQGIKREIGKLYPLWRLPLHIIPPLAKYLGFGHMVCSELVAKFLYLAGARYSQYQGTNPDTLVDEWRYWRSYEIIFEGVLK